MRYTNILLESKTNKIKENKIEEVYDKSLFNEALNNILNEIKIVNRSMMKSCNEDYISIFNKNINYMVNEYSKLVSDSFRDFKSIIEKQFKQNRELKLNINKLKKVQEYIYTGERFKFDNLFFNPSYTTFKSEIDLQIKEINNYLNKLSNAKSIEDKLNILKEIGLYNDRFNYEAFVKSHICKMLGLNIPIKYDEVGNIMFSYFRNNGVIINNNIISNNDIKKMCDSFGNPDKITSIAIRERNSLDYNLFYIKKETELSKLVCKNNINPDQTNHIVKKYLENKFKLIKFICESYVLFYTARLDAIKDKYIQDSEILLEIYKNMEDL